MNNRSAFKKDKIRKELNDIYKRLFNYFGPQHWWPGDTPFEVMVGAILTQNTAWSNVEKAINNLKRQGALGSPLSFDRISLKRLAKLIKPAGYYNVKAKRLKSFISYIRSECDYNIGRLNNIDTQSLRISLLDVNGIGPETADSILLYALNRPVFVVDAYTRRVFSRHSITNKDAGYDEIQSIFTDHLDEDQKMFNEYHALIVRLGKEYCRTRPMCEACPLGPLKITCK